MAETTEQAATAWEWQHETAGKELRYGVPTGYAAATGWTARPLYAPGTDPAIATLIAEQDRALAALATAAEDERDRLLAEANEIGRSDPDPDNRRFIIKKFLVDRWATYPADRAALRALATQEKPQGIPAGKEG